MKEKLKTFEITVCVQLPLDFYVKLEELCKKYGLDILNFTSIALERELERWEKM